MASASTAPTRSSAGASAGASAATTALPSVLLLGTGEYTTGCVDGAASTSDKPMGVVALTFFDLRERGLVGQQIALCGRRAHRNKAIRSDTHEARSAQREHRASGAGRRLTYM